MIVQNLPEGDERRTDAEEIVKAAERAAGLTRQLLAFSRRQVITQQAVALDQLVQSMQNMLQRLIGEDIQIATEIWPDLTPVLGRPHAARADSREPRRQRAGRDAGAAARSPIELRNVELDKIGVAAHPGCSPATTSRWRSATPGPAWMPRPCRESSSRFSRPRSAGKGTGLGLATVYGIVQQSNGAIEVQSRVGPRHDVLHLSAARHRPWEAGTDEAGVRRQRATKRFCSSKTTIACERWCRTC